MNAVIESEHGHDRFVGAYGQILAVSVICFCCPGMFNALSSFASGLDDPTLAYRGNAIIYIFLASSSGIAASMLTHITDVRSALIFGSIGYIWYGVALWNLTVAAFFQLPIYYGGCVVLGVSAGFLWTAQGQMIMSYATETNQGRYLSTFWIVFNLGGMCGGLLSFMMNFENNVNQAYASSGMYTAFLILMSIGAIVAIFQIAPPTRVLKSDGTFVVSQTRLRGNTPSITESPSFVESAILLRNRFVSFVMSAEAMELICLVPIFFYSNWFYTYHSLFNVSVFNSRTSGLASAFYWFSQTVTASVMGSWLDSFTTMHNAQQDGELMAAKFSLTSVAIFSNIIWVLAWFLQVHALSISNGTRLNIDVFEHFNMFVGPFLAFLLYGCADAVCQVWIYWYMGFIGQRNPSFCAVLAGAYKGFQAVGAALAWWCGASGLHPELQLYINWALCNVAVTAAFISIFRHQSYSRRNYKEYKPLIQE